MSSINSGLSIYPSGYDLNTSGTTMVFVSDEVRDPFTGSIVTSGSQIVGVQVNTSYTSINQIQRTLGINPQGDFATVADRILEIESISGSSAFVRKDGDSMSGNLQMISGAVIYLSNITSASGVSWNGSGSFIINNNGSVVISGQGIQLSSSGSANLDFGQQLNIRNTVGLSSVVAISSGSAIFYQSILPSGNINIGAVGNPINTLYVSNIPGITSLIASGSFLPLYGGVLSGNTTLSGASLLTAQSGTGTIGSLDSPFSGVYAKTGYFTNISGMSPINILSEIVISSGVTPSVSGALSLGSSNYPFSTITVKDISTNSVVISGVTFSPSSLVQASGGTVTGNISLASGATIVNAISGVNDLGTQSNPFANIWASKLNGKSSVGFAFNELLSPISPSGYTFANSPSGATVVDIATVAGVANLSRFLTPNTHYTISGNTLTLTALFAASGSLYSPFYIY